MRKHSCLSFSWIAEINYKKEPNTFLMTLGMVVSLFFFRTVKDTEQIGYLMVPLNKFYYSELFKIIGLFGVWGRGGQTGIS